MLLESLIFPDFLPENSKLTLKCVELLIVNEINYFLLSSWNLFLLLFLGLYPELVLNMLVIRLLC